MRLRLLPEFGPSRLAALTLVDLQDFADRLVTEGRSASTIQCTFLPLRAIYKRALGRGEVAVNPTRGLATARDPRT